MEFETAQNNTSAKLPIFKLGEYEMWVIRIKQYFQVQDYALLEVIENGNSWVSIPQTTQENGVSVTKMLVPTTAEEKINKKNDVKARSCYSWLFPMNINLLSLPPEWNTHVVAWMNKADIETMSIDDLYDNFQIVEQDVKRSVGTCTASTVSPNVNTTSPQVSIANFSDNVVYAFMVKNFNGSCGVPLLNRSLTLI
uniref:Uncharacterized protein n=1 Tax=Tanacetum cinerariifolium TaxID=118510 RepID=A0A699JSC4_TANCI|nr:hypothetical protein [Tanacetum cinerariifolium]